MGTRRVAHGGRSEEVLGRHHGEELNASSAERGRRKAGMCMCVF